MSQSRSPAPTLNFELHYRQGLALQTEATELLYGGAAGGGKSHLMRAALVLWCVAIPGLQAYLFRRQRNDLIKNHVEGLKGFRSMLQPLVDAKFCEIVADEIRFFNGKNGTVGSKIYLCHCKDARNVWGYQGAEIHVLAIDEITHFTEEMYTFLRSRVRAPGLKGRVPDSIAATFPRILVSGNPGYIGHEWVKRTWITPRAPMVVEKMATAGGGMLRQYIPAKLEDNPSMAEDDPDYGDRLEALYSPELARAMRDGDWDIAVGAFFASAWSRDRLVWPVFAVPPYWLRFTSMDYGHASPFSVGWWAVSPGENVTLAESGEQRWVAKGCLVKYRQWYGADGKKTNVGLELSLAEMVAGIKAREAEDEKIAYRVAGIDCWAKRGQPSISEEFAKLGLALTQANNDRRQGWKQLFDRMVGQDGDPMIIYQRSCVDSIRTVPVLPRSDRDPEDIVDDNVVEDHAAEEDRYACMSRPWTRPIPKQNTEPPDSKPTGKQLIDRALNRRKVAARI